MTQQKTPQTPGTGSHQVRPPCSGIHASHPGVSDPTTIRATARRRRTISPLIESGTAVGLDATHAYVRRYWIPIIGPGAVADLLRLTAAALSGRSLPEPIHLSTLLAEGLIRREDDMVFVPDNVRPLDQHLVRRLPPPLRRSHPAAITA